MSKVAKSIVLYKIVLRNSRQSCMAKGRFSKRYIKGHIIASVPGSLGIFCFSKKREAIDWISNICWSCDWWEDFKIIRVSPLGRCKRQGFPSISRYVDDTDLDVYYRERAYSDLKVPEGTVLVRKVRVLT